MAFFDECAILTFKIFSCRFQCVYKKLYFSVETYKNFIRDGVLKDGQSSRCHSLEDIGNLKNLESRRALVNSMGSKSCSHFPSSVNLSTENLFTDENRLSISLTKK